MSGLRWTKEEYEMLMQRRQERKQPVAVYAPVLVPVRRYRSQLEADYANVLEMRRRAGEIRDWGYERIRLLLPGGTTLKPDFDVLENDGGVSLHETKGLMREPARIKLRAAIEAYPGFRWWLIGTDMNIRRLMVPADVPPARRVVK